MLNENSRSIELFEGLSPLAQKIDTNSLPNRVFGGEMINGIPDRPSSYNGFGLDLRRSIRQEALNAPAA